VVQKIDTWNQDYIAQDVARVLTDLIEGFDPENEQHHQDTPLRFAKMLQDLTSKEEFNFTTFDNTEKVYDMVVLGPIPFYTLCAHHIIPFFGNAYVAYVPQDKIAGLSKFARAVKSISKGLWAQENLTHEIADFLEARLNAQGVAVVMKAEHLCMAMRGVQQPGVITTTSAVRGVFADHEKTAKQEFMSFVNGENK